MTKRTVWDKKECTWEVQGNLDNVIANLQKAKEEGWTSLDLDYQRGYYDCVSVEATLLRERLETDKEEQTREAQEENRRLRHEEEERRQFEQLKKKFGS